MPSTPRFDVRLTTLEHQWARDIARRLRTMSDRAYLAALLDVEPALLPPDGTAICRDDLPPALQHLWDDDVPLWSPAEEEAYTVAWLLIDGDTPGVQRVLVALVAYERAQDIQKKG